MFTGLIEGQGLTVAVERRSEDVFFRFRPLFSWDRPRRGESVACNGVCLTMETWLSAASEWTAFASKETLSCSNLGELKVGDRVNMERAMQADGRFGGHMVSGHVDCVAHVADIRPVGHSRCVRLNFAEDRSSWVVAKGSVTLDGISLTVNACGAGWLEVNIIPETWRVTTAADWKRGTAVNLETDVIGKYVLARLTPYLNGTGRSAANEAAHGGLTEDFLRSNGF